MAKSGFPLAVEIKVKHPWLTAGSFLLELGIRRLKVEKLSRLANKAQTWFMVRWCISQRFIEDLT